MPSSEAMGYAQSSVHIDSSQTYIYIFHDKIHCREKPLSAKVVLEGTRGLLYNGLHSVSLIQNLHDMLTFERHASGAHIQHNYVPAHMDTVQIQTSKQMHTENHIHTHT